MGWRAMQGLGFSAGTALAWVPMGFDGLIIGGFGFELEPG
jgi:hypothetical protein